MVSSAAKTAPKCAALTLDFKLLPRQYPTTPTHSGRDYTIYIDFPIQWFFFYY